jgi:phosphomannomutase
MAAAHGVQYRETFTGFKWIGRTALDNPDLRLVFGYEQALGYLVGHRPLDKDGITAAISLVEAVAALERRGLTPQSRLDQLAAEFGRHVTRERSVAMTPSAGVRAVNALRANPPSHLSGRQVTATEWIAAAGLLRLQVGDQLRVQVRPSGTEPKVKVYGEGVDVDPAPWVEALAARLLAAT